MHDFLPSSVNICTTLRKLYFTYMLPTFICEPVEKRNIFEPQVLTKIKSMMAALLLARCEGLKSLLGFAAMRGDADLATEIQTFHLRTHSLVQTRLPGFRTRT